MCCPGDSHGVNNPQYDFSDIVSCVRLSCHCLFIHRPIQSINDPPSREREADILVLVADKAEVYFSLVPCIAYTAYAGLPSIRPSRYGREKRQCWSQIALAPMGEKRIFRLFRVIGAMYQKIIPLFDFLGPKLNFFSLCTKPLSTIQCNKTLCRDQLVPILLIG